MAYNVGDTITLDGIESLIIYKADIEQEWGQYIVVDKNHDLCYYFTGSDYVDESETSSVINSSNKYGYEWGGYGIITEINDQSIGSGLLNTNSLIDMKLQPYEEGWNILGDKVEEFRQLYSDKWFVPSLQELDVIYNNKSNLKGLTVIDNSKLNPYYWSSCEFDPEYMGRVVHAICLTNGNHHSAGKEAHFFRCRLCRQI